MQSKANYGLFNNKRIFLDLSEFSGFLLLTITRIFKYVQLIKIIKVKQFNKIMKHTEYYRKRKLISFVGLF